MGIKGARCCEEFLSLQVSYFTATLTGRLCMHKIGAGLGAAFLQVFIKLLKLSKRDRGKGHITFLTALVNPHPFLMPR